MAKIDITIFPARLTEAMRDNGETVHSMAAKVYLTAPTISRYMRGRMAPKVTTVFAMANILEVSPEWLMGQDVAKHPVRKGMGLFARMFRRNHP